MKVAGGGKRAVLAVLRGEELQLRTELESIGRQQQRLNRRIVEITERLRANEAQQAQIRRGVDE